MSVIEVGSWEVRGGYIGDTTPFFRRPSLWCRGMEEVGDSTFSSLLKFVSSMESSVGQRTDVFLPSSSTTLCEAAAAVSSSPPPPLSSSFSCSPAPPPLSSSGVTSLWNLSSFSSFPEVHGNALRRYRRRLLRGIFHTETNMDEDAEEELVLVVPEVWHEQLEVMASLAEVVLEGQVASSFYCCRPSVGISLREGRSSAVVTDFGFSHLTTAAVLDGQTLRQSVESAPFGSAAVLSCFMQSLQEPLVAGTLLPRPPLPLPRQQEQKSSGGGGGEVSGSSTTVGTPGGMMMMTPRTIPSRSSVRDGLVSMEVANAILRQKGRVRTTPFSSSSFPFSVTAAGTSSSSAYMVSESRGGGVGASSPSPPPPPPSFLSESRNVSESLQSGGGWGDGGEEEFYAPDGSILRLSSRQCSQPFEIFFGGMEVENILSLMTIPIGGEYICWQQSSAGWRWRNPKNSSGIVDSNHTVGGYPSGVPSSSCSNTTTTSSSSHCFHVGDMIVRVKQNMDPEWQSTALPHIFSGGVSGTPGFLPRLTQELRDRDAAYDRYAACGALQVASHGEGYGAFGGASLAALSSSFFPLWVSRAEWEEDGVSVLFRKFFY